MLLDPLVQLVLPVHPDCQDEMEQEESVRKERQVHKAERAHKVIQEPMERMVPTERPVRLEQQEQQAGHQGEAEDQQVQRELPASLVQQVLPVRRV